MTKPDIIRPFDKYYSAFVTTYRNTFLYWLVNLIIVPTYLTLVWLIVSYPEETLLSVILIIIALVPVVLALSTPSHWNMGFKNRAFTVLFSIFVLVYLIVRHNVSIEVIIETILFFVLFWVCLGTIALIAFSKNNYIFICFILACLSFSFVLVLNQQPQIENIISFVILISSLLWLIAGIIIVFFCLFYVNIFIRNKPFEFRRLLRPFFAYSFLILTFLFLMEIVNNAKIVPIAHYILGLVIILAASDPSYVFSRYRSHIRSLLRPLRHDRLYSRFSPFVRSKNLLIHFFENWLPRYFTFNNLTLFFTLCLLVGGIIIPMTLYQRATGEKPDFLSLMLIGVFSVIILSAIYIGLWLIRNRSRYVVSQFEVTNEDMKARPELRAIANLATHILVDELQKISTLVKLRQVENLRFARDESSAFFVTSGINQEFFDQMQQVVNIEVPNAGSVNFSQFLRLLVPLLARIRVQGKVQLRSNGSVEVWVELNYRNSQSAAVDMVVLPENSLDEVDELFIRPIARELALKLLVEMDQVGQLGSNWKTLDDFLMGLDASAKRNWWQAIAYYRQALQTEETTQGRFGVGHYHLGAALVYQGNWREGYEHLQTAESDGPPMAETQYMLALALLYISWGEVHKKINVFEEIVYRCEKALELRPDFPEAQQLLGIAYYRRARSIERETTKLKTEIKAAESEKLAPIYGYYRQSAHHFWLALRGYDRMQNRNQSIPNFYGEAQEYHDHLLRQRMTVAHQMGDSLRALGRFSEADTYYSDVMTTFPTNIRNLADLSKTYCLSGNWQRAEEFFWRTALKNSVAAWDADINIHMGWALAGGVFDRYTDPIKTWVDAAITRLLPKHVDESDEDDNETDKPVSEKAPVDPAKASLAESLKYLDYALHQRPRYIEWWRQTNWLEPYEKASSIKGDKAKQAFIKRQQENLLNQEKTLEQQERILLEQVKILSAFSEDEHIPAKQLKAWLDQQLNAWVHQYEALLKQQAGLEEEQQKALMLPPKALTEQQETFKQKQTQLEQQLKAYLPPKALTEQQETFKKQQTQLEQHLKAWLEQYEGLLKHQIEWVQQQLKALTEQKILKQQPTQIEEQLKARLKLLKELLNKPIKLARRQQRALMLSPEALIEQQAKFEQQLKAYVPPKVLAEQQETFKKQQTQLEQHLKAWLKQYEGLLKHQIELVKQQKDNLKQRQNALKSQDYTLDYFEKLNPDDPNLELLCCWLGLRIRSYQPTEDKQKSTKPNEPNVKLYNHIWSDKVDNFIDAIRKNRGKRIFLRFYRYFRILERYRNEIKEFIRDTTDKKPVGGITNQYKHLGLASRLHNLWQAADRDFGKLDDDEKLSFAGRMALDVYLEITLLAARMHAEAEAYEHLYEITEQTLEQVEKWYKAWRGRELTLSPRVWNYQHVTLKAWKAYAKLQCHYDWLTRCRRKAKDDGTKDDDNEEKILDEVQKELEEGREVIYYHPLVMFVQAHFYRFSGLHAQALEELERLLDVIAPFDPKRDVGGSILGSYNPDPTTSESRSDLYYMERVCGQQQFHTLINEESIHALIAEIYMDVGKSDLAARHLGEAIRWSPHADLNVDHCLRLANLLNNMERYQEAQTVIDAMRVPTQELHALQLSETKRNAPAVIECVINTRRMRYARSLLNCKTLAHKFTIQLPEYYLAEMKKKEEWKTLENSLDRINLLLERSINDLNVQDLVHDTYQKINKALKGDDVSTSGTMINFSELIETVVYRHIKVDEREDYNRFYFPRIFIKLREQGSNLSKTLNQTATLACYALNEKAMKAVLAEGSMSITEVGTLKEYYANVMLSHIVLFFGKQARNSLSQFAELCNALAYNRAETNAHIEKHSLVDASSAIATMYYLLSVSDHDSKNRRLFAEKLAQFWDTYGWAQYRNILSTIDSPSGLQKDDTDTEKRSYSVSFAQQGLRPFGAPQNSVHAGRSYIALESNKAKQARDLLKTAEEYLKEGLRYDPTRAIIHYHLARLYLTYVELTWQSDPKGIFSGDIGGEAYVIDEYITQAFRQWRSANEYDRYKRLHSRMSWLYNRISAYKRAWEKRQLNGIAGDALADFKGATSGESE
jgi:hypothetical protein